MFAAAVLCSVIVLLVTAVKRLMKEAQELRDPTELYHAQPLEVKVAVILWVCPLVIVVSLRLTLYPIIKERHSNCADLE